MRNAGLGHYFCFKKKPKTDGGTTRTSIVAFYIILPNNSLPYIKQLIHKSIFLPQ